MTTLLLVHLCASLLMCGLVLFVAVVHYPLMARVGREAFVDYELRHTARTGYVVAPLMLVEAATKALLLIGPTLERGTTAAGAANAAGGAFSTDWRLWASALMLVGCWAITFGLSVPQHARLSRGFDAPTHRGLVSWHWVRTVMWLGHAGLVAWMVQRAIAGA